MRRIAIAWMLLLPLAPAAAKDPPSIAELFRAPAFAAMKISPDGKSIAALSPVNGRRNLVILDAKTRKATPRTSEGTRDIVEVEWVNSRRLLLRTGSIGARDFDYRGGGLFAVDLDGTDPRLLSEGVDEKSNATTLQFVGRPLVPLRTLPGETDDIIVQEWVLGARQARSGDVFRLDTRTGRRTSLSLGKPDSALSEGWLVDRHGVARVLHASDNGTRRIHYRAGPDAPWQKLDERPVTAPGWRVVALGDDANTLVVSDARERDKAAIVRYDVAARAFGEVLAAHPQVDLRGVVRGRDDRVLGVRYDADKAGTAWFDERRARIQRDVDRVFPDAVNELAFSDDLSVAIVATRSDVSPGSFYLLDTRAGKMDWLVDSRPWIDPKRMAPMRPVRYAARDGLSIPAYLTVPKGAGGKLPMVVVVHGGPWVDGDEWGFDPEAQFLASRGYAVLQPNFRGTTRYGWKHFSSGFNQWGLAMQDDITDGVRWAIAEGIADPARICIYGGSYGGYAALMAVAKTPELFRCAVDYVGVTDFDLLLGATWSDYAYSDLVQHTNREMIGDLERDAQRLAAASPLRLAGRITAPVLMAYGAGDFRVPIEHGLRMKAALERAGNAPEWIVAEGEGHGFRDARNRTIFYEAMERFLRKHLAAP